MDGKSLSHFITCKVGDTEHTQKGKWIKKVEIIE